MKLTLNAILLLRYVVTYTGEKEIKDKEEVDSPRRLNIDESCQRRHFFNNTEKIYDDFKKAENEAREELQKTVNEVKEKSENKNQNFSKNPEIVEKQNQLLDNLDKLRKVEHEFELTEKTKDFLVKYFKEYGDKVGYAAADDLIVEEISIKLT